MTKTACKSRTMLQRSTKHNRVGSRHTWTFRADAQYWVFPRRVTFFRFQSDFWTKIQNFADFHRSPIIIYNDFGRLALKSLQKSDLSWNMKKASFGKESFLNKKPSLTCITRTVICRNKTPCWCRNKTLCTRPIMPSRGKFWLYVAFKANFSPFYLWNISL